MNDGSVRGIARNSLKEPWKEVRSIEKPKTSSSHSEKKITKNVN